MLAAGCSISSACSDYFDLITYQQLDSLLAG
jgi:hypothetical protein